ncbi:MAG: phosphoribosylglycinamide formyltransferase [Flavobacteriales bacterium]|nr:MAG: phosphoribosylglycinamide formyltransferase [Flavobacteriales bacterium]
MNNTNKKVIIFASGSGSNALKIFEYFNNNQNVIIDSIYCNNPRANVINIFQKLNIKTVLFNKKEFYESTFLETIRNTNPDLIVLAGFLLKIPEKIVSAFENRIINIHPSLLPKYGGKGMYGLNIHKEVILNKEKLSGFTIHYVNQEYDKGAVIFQKKIKINEKETPESLSSKVLKLEHENYPLIIEKILNNEGL